MLYPDFTSLKSSTSRECIYLKIYINNMGNKNMCNYKSIKYHKISL